MKYFNNITVTVFSKPEEDESKILTSFKSLFPFDLKDKKIDLSIKSASTFNDRKIKIIETVLKKDTLTKKFLEFLLEKLSIEQKELLVYQKESRMDENLNFFIRLEKEKMFEVLYEITDDGNCFHIKMSVASFPKRRDVALKNISELLTN